MIHFLRTKDNKTIISCDVSSKDLHSSVDLENYSMYLLSLQVERKQFIIQLSELSEIRGWWWEHEKDFGDWKNIDAFVKAKYREIAEYWDLYYVTD